MAGSFRQVKGSSQEGTAFWSQAEGGRAGGACEGLQGDRGEGAHASDLQ